MPSWLLSIDEAMNDFTVCLRFLWRLLGRDLVHCYPTNIHEFATKDILLNNPSSLRKIF